MEHLRRNLSGGVQAYPADAITLITYIYVYINQGDHPRPKIRRRIEWDGLFELKLEPRP